jgi:hypothetical protein
MLKSLRNKPRCLFFYLIFKSLPVDIMSVATISPVRSTELIVRLFLLLYLKLKCNLLRLTLRLSTARGRVERTNNFFFSLVWHCGGAKVQIPYLFPSFVTTFLVVSLRFSSAACPLSTCSNPSPFWSHFIHLQIRRCVTPPPSPHHLSPYVVGRMVRRVFFCFLFCLVDTSVFHPFWHVSQHTEFGKWVYYAKL